jgi:glycosyltransferase involved in cell wall biosynthesis
MNLLLFNLKTDIDDSILGFTTGWINALARHCGRIYVITMQKGRVAVAENVEVYSLGKERDFSKAKRALWFYRHLFYILKKDKIDVCFAHMAPKFALLAGLIMKIKKIPIVLWYAHSSTGFILRLVHLLIENVVTSSPEGFRIKSKKVIVTGQGIDASLFVPARKKTGFDYKRILTIGRLSPIKNHETLVSAIDLLVKEKGVDNIKVIIVGGTPEGKSKHYEIKLKRKVLNLKLSNYIKFVGNVPFINTVAYYQKGDIFVNLSDTDSIDKAILEAMACGCIPITSNRSFAAVFGKFKELLIVPKDSSRLLAEKILKISCIPNREKDTLRKSLRQIVVDHHNLDQLSVKLMEVFKNIRIK